MSWQQVRKCGTRTKPAPYYYVRPPCSILCSYTLARKAALNELRLNKLKRLKPGPEIMDPIEKCWVHDPESRPKMVDVLVTLNRIFQHVESYDYKPR